MNTIRYFLLLICLSLDVSFIVTLVKFPPMGFVWAIVVSGILLLLLLNILIISLFRELAN